MTFTRPFSKILHAYKFCTQRIADESGASCATKNEIYLTYDCKNRNALCSQPHFSTFSFKPHVPMFMGHVITDAAYIETGPLVLK